MADPVARLLAANTGLAATVVLWGTMVPLTERLLATYDPFLLAALRYLVALPVLVGFLVLREGTRLALRTVPWRRVHLLGGIGMCGFATFFTLGIAYSDAVTAAVILTSGPVVASVMERVMYGTRPAPGLGLALALAVGGGLLVVHGNPAREGAGIGFRGGEGLLVLAQGCWSWYSMKAQEWLRGASQVRITTLTASTAALWLVVVLGLAAVVGGDRSPPPWPAADELAIMLWIGAGGAGIAIVFWNNAARAMGVSVAALFLNLVPAVAIATAVLLGAAVTAEQLAGGALVLAGIVQVQARRLLRSSGRAR